MHHLPNNGIPSAASIPPTSNKSTTRLDNSPRQPEMFEENIPHGTSNLTMKKKVIR
jgi:hypothetical protein